MCFRFGQLLNLNSSLFPLTGNSFHKYIAAKYPWIYNYTFLTNLPCISQAFPCYFPSISLLFPIDFPAISHRFPCYFLLISRVFIKHFPNISMEIHNHFPVNDREIPINCNCYVVYRKYLTNQCGLKRESEMKWLEINLWLRYSLVYFIV